MKNKTVIFIVVLLIVAMIIYFVWQYKRLSNYSYRIDKIQFSSFGLKKISGKLYIAFENKSDVNITIKSVDLNMLINNVHIAKLESPGKIEIAANSYSMVVIDFAVNPSSVLSIKNILALNGILNKDKVLFGFIGTAYIEKGAITIKLPMNINKPLSQYTTKE